MSPDHDSTPAPGDTEVPAHPPPVPHPGPAAHGALLSAVAVFGTRGLSLLLTVVLGTLSAAYFGAGAAKDCYVIAQAIPSLLTTVLVGGLYSLLIVALTEVGPRAGVAGQIALVRRTLGGVSLILIPIILAATIYPRPFIALIAPGFGPDRLELSGRLLPLTMLAMIGSVYFAIVRSLYNARLQFAVPGFANLLVGVTSLVTLVLLANRAGIFALALGPVLGSTLAVAALGVGAFRSLKDPGNFAPLAPGPIPAGSGMRFWRDFVPMSIGANFGQVNLLVDNAFASFLPEGSITQIGFASVILSNAELLTIFSLAEVAFPRFTAASQRGSAALEDEVRLNLRYMILLTAPISAGCVVFGAPLARLLFERGEFGPDSTTAVAGILACFAPEVLFMGFFAIFWRILVAHRRMSAMVVSSLGAIALNAVLNQILMRPFGIRGIALATSAVTTLFAVILGSLIRRQGLKFITGEELRFAARVIVSAIVMGGVGLGWSALFERTFDVKGEAARLFETGSGLALGAGLYAALLQVQGIRMVPDVLGRVARITTAWRRS